MSTTQEEPKKEEQVTEQAVEQKETVAEEAAPADGEKKEQDEDIKEEGEITDNEGEESKKDGEAAGEDAAAGTTPKVEIQGEDAPLTKILEQLDQLSEKEQQSIKENMERISTYPKELPLSQSWSESGSGRSFSEVEADHLRLNSQLSTSPILRELPSTLQQQRRKTPTLKVSTLYS
jgi:hypothetical protein